MQKQLLNPVLSFLKLQLPDVGFVAGNSLHWSPKTTTITYRGNDDSEEAIWGLLHEAAHALLAHKNYQSDAQLLLLEVQAWHRSQSLAKELGMTMDEDYIQSCIDTYRDWLHQRSTCPRCGMVSLQETIRQYRCHNCNHVWRVSMSRFCRPYRLTKKSQLIEKSPVLQQTTFR